MSTYTDLHNRIKENLTILRKPGSKDDGMSPQKVILVNPENQFYGTFNGKMNITGGILSGLKIIDSELEGVKLDDASVDGMSLRELKTTVDVNTQDIEQLQKDAKTISAAHDALSVGLSGAVDNLSVAVNEKLDNAVEEVKKSISGVVGNVTTLSIGLDDLSSKVETLSSGMLNGVVYRGQLVLHRDYYTLPRQLFNDDPACCLLEGTQAPLKNGWMWRVYLDRENVSGDYVHVSDPNTGRELDLGKGDYIIIKNHLTSLYEVIPDNQMRMDDFDVINAQDEDDTKLAVLKQVSAYLDNKIDESLVSAKDYTDEVSAGLSALFDGKLSSVSAYALAESIKYTNGVSSEICSTINTKLITLSNDLSSYSNKLCSDLSIQVDAEFVHRAGDTIAKLSVEGELSVAGKTTISNALELNDDFNASTGTYAKISRDGVVIKTHAGTTLKSDDQIEIKTNAPIVETASRFKGTFTNGLEISSDAGLASLSVNGKTIQSTFDDLSNYLDGKKLDVNLARELSSKLALSSDISWDLNDYNNTPGYMVSNDVGLSYDPVAKRIYLITNGSHHASAEIDTSDFVKDGMLKEAHFLPGGHDGSGVPEIELDFNTDSGIDTIYVPVGDLVDIYTASEDGITLSNNVFSLKYDDIKERAGINAISTSLYGSVDPYKQGWLDSLQEQINAISSDDFGVVAFTGHLVPDVGTSTYENLSGFFKSCGGFDDSVNPNHVKNGATYNIFFRDALSNNISAVTVNTDAGVISVGNGDVFIVHDHSNSRFIHLSDLVYADDTHGNTYLLKAGVSRYEFEAEAKKREDDDAFISAWIKQNFANTGDESYALTTTLKQAISADNNLSVAKDAFVLNDLSVAGQLFVNGAQLGIKTEVDPGTGEDKTIAETTADEISFVAGDVDFSSEPKTTINLTKNFITFQNAAVDIDATSSFILSADKTKVIDATSSQVEILSVLTVSSDQARITTLSSGVLSSDALTSRVADISEKLSATSAYIDWLSATEAKIIDVEVENSLSIKTFSNLVAEDTGSSIADLCVGLSVGIQTLSTDLSGVIDNLSADLSSEIETLSTNLSSNISTLTSQMVLALSALDKDPLSSLNADSKISAVIDAVLDIRDTLSALRSILRI